VRGTGRALLHTECSVSPRTLGTKRVPAGCGGSASSASSPSPAAGCSSSSSEPTEPRDPPGHQLAGLARSKDAAAEPASHLLRLQQHRRASACSQPPHEAFLPAATPPALPSVRASGPALAPLGSLGSEALPHESRHSAGRYAARKPRMVASTHNRPQGRTRIRKEKLGFSLFVKTVALRVDFVRSSSETARSSSLRRRSSSLRLSLFVSSSLRSRSSLSRWL